MKKIIAVLIVAVMMITMIPALSVSAISGDWVSLRDANGYNDESSYTPAAGYHYTDRGIETISPDYTNCTINQRLMTKERYSLTTNNDSENGHVLSLDFTVLDFPYKGDNGTQDEWISVSIWSESNLSQGSTKNGQGYCTLIRGTGDGSAIVQSCLVNDQFNVFAQDAITAEFDDDGCEMYNMIVDYDGSSWSIAFNGKTIGYGKVGEDDVDSMFSKDIFAEGAYVGITYHSGQANSTASMLITNFNGSVPKGDDKEAPEENVSVFADMADSSTVGTNMPAVIWDSTYTSFKKLTGSNLEYTVQEDGTIKAVALSVSPYITFGVKTSISYEAADFPVIAVLTKDCWADSGNCYYCAGEVLSAKDDCATNFYLDDEEIGGDWLLGFINVPEVASETGGTWEGRINNIRIGFNNMDVTDEEYSTFTVGFIGAFRSTEEAVAYAEGYVATLTGDTGDTGDTTGSDDTQGDVTKPDDDVTTKADDVTTKADDVTTKADDATTKADVTTAADVTTKADVTTAAPDVTTNAADNTTKADGSESSGGCGGVVGGIFAVLGVITLAGVAIRKKH